MEEFPYRLLTCAPFNVKSGPFEWLYIALNFVLTEWLASNDGNTVSYKFAFFLLRVEWRGDLKLQTKPFHYHGYLLLAINT